MFSNDDVSLNNELHRNCKCQLIEILLDKFPENSSGNQPLCDVRKGSDTSPRFSDKASAGCSITPLRSNESQLAVSKKSNVFK